MEKIKVLIVEDKLLIAEAIAGQLRKNSLDVIGICSTGEEAIQFATEKQPDLILMDIELSGAIDGISAAKLIQEKQSLPIIFLSDYKDEKTLERAKKVQPANYITKPFLEVDLIRAIDLAFSNSQHQKAATSQNPSYKNIFLRTENQTYIKLAIHEILYLEAGRAYCKIMTDKKSFTLATSMNHVLAQLPGSDFIQVHRSYCVNINRITSIDGNTIKIDNHEIQMSKESRENLMSLVKIIK